MATVRDAHRIAGGGVRIPETGGAIESALAESGGAASVVRELYGRIEQDPGIAPVFPHFHPRGLIAFFEAWSKGGPPLPGPWDVDPYQRHLEIHVTPGLAERWLGHFEAVLANRGLGRARVESVMKLLRKIALQLAHSSDEPFSALELRKACAGVSTTAMRTFEELRIAARRGDAKLVGDALRRDPGLARRRGVLGVGLLWEAAGAGRTKVVELLIEKGTDPDVPGTTPFSADIACGMKGKPGSVVALTPYAHARWRKKRVAAETLLAAGAVLDAYTLAFLGDEAGLRELIDADAECATALDPADHAREVTPLHHAVCGGSRECAQLLIERGAEVARHSKFLLTVAASANRADLVEQLLAAGADARATELIGPLDPEERPIAESLVASGFDVNETERWGPMLPRVCRPDVARNRVHRARVLLDLGADPNRIGRTGLAPLHYAVRGRDVELARLLIDRGADAALPDRDGRRPEEHAKLSRSKIDPGPVLAALGR